MWCYSFNAFRELVDIPLMLLESVVLFPLMLLESVVHACNLQSASCKLQMLPIADAKATPDCISPDCHYSFAKIHLQLADGFSQISFADCL